MDFTEIVPAMMSSVSSLEVFHSLIDLPCMTVALEVMEKTKNLDFTALSPVTDYEPTRAIDAFKNALFRPMFNFFTRAEGGHGDTIDRYNILNGDGNLLLLYQYQLKKCLNYRGLYMYFFISDGLSTCIS